MTIGQFLKKQKLNSGTKLRFQFTDQQGINWSCEAPASRLERELIENFPCDLNRKENNLFIFNLDLNKIPEGLFTTFSEIYELSAKKSDEENITVREYLQELEKGFDEGTNPKVFFYQKILMKDPNGREDIYSFSTQNAVSLEEAVNDPLSHLFVDNVETRDDTIFVNLVTTGEKRMEELKELKQQQEEADKRLNFASNIFLVISIVVGIVIAVLLGSHIGGDLGFGIGLLCAFFGGLFLYSMVESILEATGKIVYEDGKLKFKRK